MTGKRPARNIFDLIFKAIALAMAVAVIALNILHAASVETSLLLLGTGLFGLAITGLDKE